MSVVHEPAPVRLDAPASPSAGYLPSPPTDGEKYAYLGRQHRWIFPGAIVAFVLVAVSMTLFSVSRYPLYVFVLPVGLYALTLFVSSATSLRRPSRSGRAHKEKVAAWLPDYIPTVDVFLPTAGEPLEILRNTYEHVSRLEWPGAVCVYVLDDSARRDVQVLAAEYGFTYRTRPDRGHLKKAGNLRFGFENSSGDVIAVFDADFVPRPDYLYELMPYLDDPEVGIVQSPQYFDTDERMHWLQRNAGATQEMFYRWIQPSRDRFQAAICVGTCALYRRSALDEAGGFAQIAHSEDVHTGVELMKTGYHVRYVPVVVAKGVCPADYAPFVNQQYRWCTGSMSLLRNPTFHHHPLLSWRQRVSFFGGFLYYISTAVNVLLAPLPPLIMLWVLTEHVHPANSMWMLGSTLMWLLVYPLVHRSRWRLSVLRVQHLYSWAHLVAIADHFTGRTKGWVATGVAGGSTPVAASVRRVMLVHGCLTQALLAAGLAFASFTQGIGETWAMALLWLANAYVVLPAVWSSVADMRAPGRIVKGVDGRPAV